MEQVKRISEQIEEREPLPGGGWKDMHISCKSYESNNFKFDLSGELINISSSKLSLGGVITFFNCDKSKIINHNNYLGEILSEEWEHRMAWSFALTHPILDEIKNSDPNRNIINSRKSDFDSWKCEFDSKGNWIKKELYKNNQIHFVYKRDIYYFE